MLVEGDADQLAELVRVDTQAISMTGVSSDRAVNVGLDLPTGVLAVGDDDTDRVLVTVGGSVADLDRLSGTALVVDLDVTGLQPGTEQVPVSLDLPTGATLVSATPSRVGVTISGPSPSPSAPAGG